MNPVLGLRTRWLIFGLLPLFGLASCTPEAPEPPNIIVVLADDLGYSDIGAYGGEIATPNLDSLAEQGLLFTQFYNAARCCPTRASLLTGLYPHQAGMGRMVSSVSSTPQSGPYQGFLTEDSPTMAEALRQAGYRTYMAGKWHVGEKPEHWPRQRGFDRYFGLISGASSYYEIIKDQPRVRQMVLDDELWEPPAEGFYMTDAITDYAARYIQDHATQNRAEPFFLYVAYTAPHWPLHALPEDIAKYSGRYDEGWGALRKERYDRMKALGLIDDRHILTPRPASIPTWEEVDDKADWARRMEVYAAMIDRMDQGIGRILEVLEEAGEDQNTLVLFLSDNGGCAESIEGRQLHNHDAAIGARGSYVAYKEPWANASNTPFRLYKQWTHEGGIGTPFIAYWPNGIQRPGRLTAQTGHVMDIMATALDLAGVSSTDSDQAPSPFLLEGKSLAPIFSGETRVGHEALFWEHFNNKAMRKGRWKIVYDNRRTKSWELFDLEADPTEVNNLADQQPERLQSMIGEWEAWAERVGVTALPQ